MLRQLKLARYFVQRHWALQEIALKLLGLFARQYLEDGRFTYINITAPPMLEPAAVESTTISRLG